MNELEYNAAPGIRRSDLWKISDSPEKFRYAMDHPEDERSPALVFGSAAHKLLLEPTEFFLEYAVLPEGLDRRTKEGKARYAEFLEREAGKEILDAETYDTIRNMAMKVMASPMAVKLLAGRREQPFFWTDPDTGVECKVKVDCLTWLEGEEIPVIVDYKTAKSAKTEAFMRDAYNYGYHLQAAMYSEAVMRKMNLKERPMFVFLIQEKEPCYAINIVTVPEDTMNYGLDTFRELLGIYKRCCETGVWYGYEGATGQPNELSLPGWLKKESEKSE